MLIWYKPDQAPPNMHVRVLVESSATMTFICLKYDGFVMLVAFTEKSALSRVYGKSLSKVILIFVFRVGFADGGTSCMPALVFAIVAKDRLLLTV